MLEVCAQRLDFETTWIEGGETMPRRMEIFFRKRNVRAVATLLDDAAPRTCEALWESLPLEGDVFHAKWANCEVYTLVPPLKSEPGRENQTVYPIPGDV